MRCNYIGDIHATAICNGAKLVAGLRHDGFPERSERGEGDTP
jgi:hypothetical protein